MATQVYTGHGNTSNWSDGLNWQGGVAPGTADTALLEGGANASVNGTVSVDNVMVFGAMSVAFTGTVNTYGTGYCAGFMVCDEASVTFAPGSTLNDLNGGLLVGLDDVGTLIAQGTAGNPTSLTTSNATIGKEAIATGNVTIDHATWTNTGGVVFLGWQGVGTLDVVNGGRVTDYGNFAMGMFAGAVGTATLSSGGTVTVDGSACVGGAGTGVLTVNAGSVFDVKNMATVGAASTISMQGGTVSVGDISAWLTVKSGGSVVGNGVVTTRAGGMFQNNGMVAASGGTLQLDGVVIGTGTTQIDANSTLALTGTAATLPSIVFAGADATLALSHGDRVTGVLSGFSFGDHIAMAGINAATWNSSSDLLTLSSGGNVVDRINIGGGYAGDMFSVTQSNGIGVISVLPGH